MFNKPITILMAGVLGALAIALSSAGQTASMLKSGPTVQLPQAAIWGGISWNGSSLSITTTHNLTRSHLFLHRLDRELNSIAAPVQLTFDSDIATAAHITDHKHLYLEGRHFVTFSVAGDSDLYAFSVDREGRRDGPVVAVVEGTGDRTNDMMFCTDGDLMFVSYFHPTAQSTVRFLGQDLKQPRPPLITSLQLPHNNLGGMYYLDGRFLMFSGDKAGPNSNLIMTAWNHDWTPAIPRPQALIPAPSGGGYFFATGIAFDSRTRHWILAFHHVLNSDADGTTHIDLAIFDESFHLLEHLHGPTGHRPHLLLLDRTLYMVYDRAGVFVTRYDLQATGTASSSKTTLYWPDLLRSGTVESGVALANESDSPLSVQVAAYTPAGQFLPAAGSNPLSLILPPHGQIARMFGELFGSAGIASDSWMEMSADAPGLTGFVAHLGSALETMDSMPAVRRALQYVVFPFLENEITLVQPASSSSEVFLRRFDAAGREILPASSVTLNGRSRLTLAGNSLQREGAASLLVQSSTGVVAGMRSLLNGKYEADLPGLDANAGGRRLWAPQFVSGGGLRSSLILVNLDDALTIADLEWKGDRGENLSLPISVEIPARARTQVTDAAFVDSTLKIPVQGYVTISSRAARLTGAVEFRDDKGEQFRSLLPLVTNLTTDLVLPHIVEDGTCFTGMALLNPGLQPASVQMTAYDAAGKQLKSIAKELPSGERMSRLVSEWFPDLGWLQGGQLRIISSMPIAGFALFGTRSLSSLSVLPLLEPAATFWTGAAPAENYSKVDLQSDFFPPHGGVDGGPGPAMNRLMIARSQDGLRFTRSRTIVTDQGAVPDLVVDRQGKVYLYYTGWAVADQINKTVVAISGDDGTTWAFRRLELARAEGETDLVDPDVVLLDDGTFRLYFTVGSQGGYARTHYADSPDGIRFTRRGVAFDPGSQVLDPSALRIGQTWHIFGGGGDPEANWHGTSTDGAVYQSVGKMLLRVEGFGQMMANGLAVDGGYRFYGFGNNRQGGISSFFTQDGISWTADEGYRLAGDAENGLEGGLPTDPAVVRLRDGSYLMVYSCSIPKKTGTAASPAFLK